MAVRPIFIPTTNERRLVIEKEFDFNWSPGFAVSQKQKSINSLHQIAKREGFYPLLEVSSKSEDPKGAAYSAFRLKVEHSQLGYIPLECAFQGSKVFLDGGPFTELYEASPLEAKKDPRTKNSGPLQGFEFEGDFWGLIPQTAFYDFLYLNSLKENKDLIDDLLMYKGFSDIEFNPKRSVNCQARSCALAVSLVNRGDFERATQSKQLFISYLQEYGYGKGKPTQDGKTIYMF
ncbi:MAG: hypothetical protein HQ556_06615 [Candidatus Marinimicrobia bacterium]|nr:hypothetical protein [Candidatus Neomarinimicrobiota bacterium]